MTTGSEVFAALSASSVEYWPAVTTNCELRNTLRNICLSTGILPGIVTSAPCSITPYGIPIFGPKIPTLGVCLGHQCMGQVYGATVGQAGEIRHGKTSEIHHTGQGVLAGLPNPFNGIRYHSLVVYPDSLPDSLEITAWTDNGLIMGMRHKEYPVEGVQFHPESILTPVGKDLLQNFLNQVY